ncbi:MAG TPA: hypothetical protein VNZ64_13240 [Candidatus Acidoferrum sp.]|jgi:hypothetical protein|nr:hypothetical protein [Candidatus Acidoferrum sp.]
MDITVLSTVIALLVALSVASERFVEIIKGVIPFLNQQNNDPAKEGLRRTLLQVLAVVAGITTAWIASPAIPDAVHVPNTFWAKIALGLLASGGSGFWNSMLTYVNKAKDAKKLEVFPK